VVSYWKSSQVRPAVDREIAARSPSWVLNNQAVGWNEDVWQKRWTKYPVPGNGHILQAISSEVQAHKTIRRRFVFGYANKTPADFITVAMAWGYGGNDNRGPSRTVAALTGPIAPAIVLNDVRQALNSGGTAAAFSAMFAHGKPRLANCNVAFATKVLHFLAYCGSVRPRPLIYDLRVADALARIPTAPYVPHPGSLITGTQYEGYCEWAERYAVLRNTAPVVVEYALWAVGGRLC